MIALRTPSSICLKVCQLCSQILSSNKNVLKLTFHWKMWERKECHYIFPQKDRHLFKIQPSLPIRIVQKLRSKLLFRLNRIYPNSIWILSMVYQQLTLIKYLMVSPLSEQSLISLQTSSFIMIWLINLRNNQGNCTFLPSMTLNVILYKLLNTCLLNQWHQDSLWFRPLISSSEKSVNLNK